MKGQITLTDIEYSQRKRVTKKEEFLNSMDKIIPWSKWIDEILKKSGQMMKGGTIVDATIISAPSSTKNSDHKRDEEMHSTKKGGIWYYGMKLHTGVDAGSGYIHTIIGTAANIHDITETKNLLREDDEICYGDSGYLSIEKRKEIKEDIKL